MTLPEIPEDKFSSMEVQLTMLAIIYIAEGSYLTIISLPSAKGLQGEASSSLHHCTSTLSNTNIMNQQTNLDQIL